MSEEWRRIPGFDNYEVSDRGSVRRAVETHRHPVLGGNLKPTVDGSGYGRVDIYRDGKRYPRRVHVLVCEAFLGPRAGVDVRHLDGNPRNNTLANLAWGTRAENVQDAIQHGRHKGGRRQSCQFGHKLEGANLSPSDLSRGSRACLSCRRGKAAVARAAARGEALDARTTCDSYYEKIGFGNGEA